MLHVTVTLPPPGGNLDHREFYSKIDGHPTLPQKLPADATEASFDAEANTRAEVWVVDQDKAGNRVESRHTFFTVRVGSAEGSPGGISVKDISDTGTTQTAARGEAPVPEGGEPGQHPQGGTRTSQPAENREQRSFGSNVPPPDEDALKRQEAATGGSYTGGGAAAKSEQLYETDQPGGAPAEPVASRGTTVSPPVPGVKGMSPTQEESAARRQARAVAAQEESAAKAETAQRDLEQRAADQADDQRRRAEQQRDLNARAAQVQGQEQQRQTGTQPAAQRQTGAPLAAPRQTGAPPSAPQPTAEPQPKSEPQPTAEPQPPAEKGTPLAGGPDDKNVPAEAPPPPPPQPKAPPRNPKV
jgi:hypothetical protein